MKPVNELFCIICGKSVRFNETHVCIGTPDINASASATYISVIDYTHNMPVDLILAVNRLSAEIAQLREALNDRTP